MISYPTFFEGLASVGRKQNTRQSQEVLALKGAPLFIVARPGTGKTASLTMSRLKPILVDGFLRMNDFGKLFQWHQEQILHIPQRINSLFSIG
jgi:hypothetical protein